MIITTIPILIGAGVPFFGQLEQDIDLQLLGSKSSISGFIQAHYKLLSSVSIEHKQSLIIQPMWTL